MNKITDKTRARSIEILVNSFKANPGALRIIKRDRKFDQRLYELCYFCINIAMQKDGAYITSDQKGIALIFNSKRKIPLIPMLSAYVRLGTRCIGWDRAIPILWKEKIMQSKRLKQEYLHFWMLGIEDNSFGLRTIIEIRDFAYAMSEALNVPIIAETRLEQNRKVYERYGFKCYDTWKSKSETNEVSFLMRDPKKD